MDKPSFFCLSSTYKAVSVDKPSFFCLSSTYKAVSVDKPADYVQFRPKGALKIKWVLRSSIFISAKSFWRTALKDSVMELLHHKAPGASAFPKKLPGFVVATAAAVHS
ncbi:MAG: hypothetical protein PHP15_06640 [Bacteroidales bacterium]|nr:hypothetical protein [Bacteroidales bacterium]